MTTTKIAPSTQKVRRDVAGGKRGDGHLRDRLVRRPDPERIRVGKPDPTLTSVGGLAGFGRFLRREGLDGELRECFRRLKTHAAVVYPMDAQMRLLVDAAVAGETRVFGIESLAADPLFVHQAGGVVPSIDTLYRDLCRFDSRALRDAEEMVGRHGLEDARHRKLREVHVDVDTTVEPLFGRQEGARPGPNPHYHGRPSYHPVVARLAETGTFVGGKLRTGDTGFGDAEAPLVARWIRRVRAAVGRDCLVYVRVDAAGDCTELLRRIHAEKAFFIVKAKMTGDLLGTIAPAGNWRTVEWDARGRPQRQVAEIDFTREEWTKAKCSFRVVAVRTRDKATGKQIFLWDDLDYTVQAFITNDRHSTPDEIAKRYDDRAGVEPLIAEAKYAWGIAEVPSHLFAANHAAFLLKLLAFNLMRRFVSTCYAPLAGWRAPWLRRVLILVPGRFVTRGRQRVLRLPPRSALMKWLN